MRKADTIKKLRIFRHRTIPFKFFMNEVKLWQNHKYTRNTTRRYECKCKEIRDVMNSLASDLIVIIVVVIPCELSKNKCTAVIYFELNLRFHKFIKLLENFVN